ncbi:MAG: HNH endonuclease [Sideroxydans sp.]|jgi:5-methylcytosine-specific restriction endonuclease McrA
MARSKSDIANSAIRIFLQDVGKYYDEARGLEPFVPKVGQVDELLDYFRNECCYCGTQISRQTISLDHLIPMNKSTLGLHAWGNVVPCCQSCNNEKQQKGWSEFLEMKAESDTSFSRRKRIEEFVASKKYDPNLNLHEYADNLYEDVGAVAMTLIHLRYKQAEEGIKQLLGPTK